LVGVIDHRAEARLGLHSNLLDKGCLQKSCHWREDSDSNLIHEEVFRNLLKDLLIKATKHMLQNCLGLNLNPLGDGCAPPDLHRKFPESCYFVIQHEVAVLHKCLIMTSEVV
jgi:hypothetical protein